MRKNKTKVILSTFGPLHLIKSAESLSDLVDIRVIQGWIPTWRSSWFLTVASKIVGRDLRKSFRKRTPSCLSGRNTSIAFAEFYLWACKLFKLQSPLKSSNNAAYIYGKASRKYIKNADIFHVRSGSGFGGAIERAKAMGMKVIVDHSIAHPVFMDNQLRSEYAKNGVEFDLGMDNPFWANIVEDCRKGDRLLVNSQFVKDTFVENGFDANKIDIVLLGVRQDFIGLKNDYALKNDTLKILFTGGFGFRKGAEYVLKALCELDQRDFKYEMTIVGDYRGAMSLYNKFTPRHVHFVSTVPQDELKQYLAETDVYLFPSLCEGCASSGMEAMAAGVPVIATKESGLPITDEENGIIIESKSVSQIVDSILVIKENMDLRKKLGSNARNLIRNNYSWEKYACRVKSIYDDMLS